MTQKQPATSASEISQNRLTANSHDIAKMKNKADFRCFNNFSMNHKVKLKPQNKAKIRFNHVVKFQHHPSRGKVLPFDQSIRHLKRQKRSNSAQDIR